jgi:hypothetical protein
MLTFNLLAPHIKTLEEIREERRDTFILESLNDFKQTFKKNFERCLRRFQTYKKSGSIPQLHLSNMLIYRLPKQQYYYNFSKEIKRWKIIKVLVKQNGTLISSAGLAEMTSSKSSGAIYAAVAAINKKAKENLKILDRLICGSRAGYRINPKFQISNPFGGPDPKICTPILYN